MESHAASAELLENRARRKRFWRWVWLILVGAPLLLGLYCWVWVPFRAERLTFHGDSTALQKTVIVPTLDTPLPPGKNVIWCASYQAAWDQFRTVSAGSIQQPPKLLGAEDISTRLNRSPFPTADLPSTSYVVAGLEQDGIVSTIKSTLRDRFPDARMPKFAPSQGEDLIAYGYLAASIKFPLPYFNADPINFAGKRVACFGIREKDNNKEYPLRSQVSVLYENGFASDSECIIDPCNTSPVQLVLARVTPGKSLANTIATCEQKIAVASNGDNPYMSFVPGMGSDDILLIPNLRWIIDNRFSEMEGKEFAPAGCRHYLKRAQQTISFSLNRSGVKMESYAKSQMQALGTGRNFIFDHSFLLYLRLRGHVHTFFAMWVDNAELLTGM